MIIYTSEKQANSKGRTASGDIVRWVEAKPSSSKTCLSKDRYDSQIRRKLIQKHQMFFKGEFDVF